MNIQQIENSIKDVANSMNKVIKLPENTPTDKIIDKFEEFIVSDEMYHFIRNKQGNYATRSYTTNKDIIDQLLNVMDKLDKSIKIMEENNIRFGDFFRNQKHDKKTLSDIYKIHDKWENMYRTFMETKDNQPLYTILQKVPDDTDCAICSDNLNTEESVKLDNCNHMFHKECIDVWYNRKKNVHEEPTCPLCRVRFFGRRSAKKSKKSKKSKRTRKSASKKRKNASKKRKSAPKKRKSAKKSKKSKKY